MLRTKCYDDTGDSGKPQQTLLPTVTRPVLSKESISPKPGPSLSRSRTTLIFCAVLGVVFAEPLLAQTISPASAQEDFDVLWKSIREAHGGLNRHVAPGEFDRRVAA